MKLFTRSKKIGIDLGTSNTLLYTKEKGIILREPSVIAINTKNGRILAVGSEAKNMIGRVPGDIEAIRPLKDGVIANFDVSQEMLKKFVEKAIGKSGCANSKVVICYPSGITEVEKKPLMKLQLKLGHEKL